MLIRSKNEHTDYQYNSNGQLTKTTEKITDATTNNQISQITVTFTYDNNGNMLSTAKSGSETGTTSYSYNTMNQMIQYTNPKGVKTYYTYNGNGQRETKKIGTNTIKYYYDGGKVVNETENGAIIATNIRGINLIARQDNKGAIAYYIYNGHGDTVNLILSNGSITSTYDYDIYGKETKATEGSIKNPYRYAGEYYDEESGLYYLRARYYDPSISRFISEDTYKGDIKDPLSLNLYTYCYNNPMKYEDPSGHWPKFVDNIINAIKGTHFVNFWSERYQNAKDYYVNRVLAYSVNDGIYLSPKMVEMSIDLPMAYATGEVITGGIKNGIKSVKYFKGMGKLTLKGTNYSAEYAQKLKDTYKVFKNKGYDIGEHGLNRIFGRINQGKIKSVNQIFDTLETGTKYQDTVKGGTVIFKDGISIHIADDGFIKTVIGNAKIKDTWELIK